MVVLDLPLLNAPRVMLMLALFSPVPFSANSSMYLDQSFCWAAMNLSRSAERARRYAPDSRKKTEVIAKTSGGHLGKLLPPIAE